MEPIIEIKNLGKKYRINHQQGGHLSFREVLANTFKSPLSSLHKKLKLVTGTQKQEEFWALKDINFNVEKGEVIGIIGNNGAGKSTLLKILSQITPPTTGEITLRGTVGSLLEVGTGFHPELTGRENIFLNGAILGIKKRDIVKRFDEIVQFAGIEKFLDTPVKHYSSGMYVRLAFSVAAYIETDILIIDEVLAVGDAEFQKKCLGKIENITKNEGRTIFFVSHNMAAIKQLCTKVILLSDGKVEMIGSAQEIVNAYLNKDGKINHLEKTWQEKFIEIEDFVRIERVRILGENNQTPSTLLVENPIVVSIEYEVLHPTKNVQLGFQLVSNSLVVFESVDLPLPEFDEYIRQPGMYSSNCAIPAHLLNVGHYSFSVFLHTPRKVLVREENVLEINTASKNTPTGAESQDGLMRPILDWDTRKLG